MMLKTLEKEQVYVQMAVSIQEQIIQCFDEKLHATFEYNFRINNGNLQTILRSDSIPEFDININIYTDEAAEHIKSNSWTLVFGKLTVSFREWYLNENVDLKNKIMAVFEQEKERHETDYYLNKLPKKPSVIYNNLPYAQLVESIFDDLLSMNMEHYGIDLGPANIYLDVYKDRFIIHARWMDDRARGLGDDYEIGDLSITFQDSPEKVANTLDDHLKIDLITSGNSAAKIEEEIQQMIDNRRNTFLEKIKSE
ncbi:MAG: hypothetical protein MI810_05920 [Flavobacteriales bacterium]|nr:hypothetical protein [Flavobacteriales bacterium]